MPDLLKTPDGELMSDLANTPVFIPVTKWNNHYEWPPIGGMRHLIFYANTNGFAPAFKRVGRRVLVDADRFWSIVKEQRRGS